MHIGILETGQNRAGLVERHGSYPDMFRTLLGTVDPALTFSSYAVLENEWPASPLACDAWLITGSSHTAFEHLPWMEQLEALLRAIMDRGGPIVGICFGHQILAQAMGGEVKRATAGWGLGIHTYDVISTPSWVEPERKTISLCVVHQDQVVRLPAEAEVMASSPFCPNAVITYGDRALTFQAHPEFSPTFVADLVDELDHSGVPEDTIAEARACLSNTLKRPDSDYIAALILRFFREGRTTATQ